MEIGGTMSGSGETRRVGAAAAALRKWRADADWSSLAGLGSHASHDEAGHGERVGRAALALARALGMRERDAALIGDAARLHDIGKLAVSGSILRKPGRLSEREFAAVKTHTLHGWTLLGRGLGPRFELAAQIALYHHENWDGSGYPFGLAGEEIPLPARIVSVADVFDALVHARSYKGAWAATHALSEIAGEAGRKFDPRVVRAFLSLRLPLIELSAPAGPARLHDSRSDPTSEPASAHRSCGSPHTRVLIEDTGAVV